MKSLKKMKKLVAVLVTVAMIASFFSGVVAAAPATTSEKVDTAKLTSDITDKDVKDAVMRLAAFGVVNGMPDGQYHPEAAVTRAQFAKILVTSLKMDSAANASSTTQFSDVSGHWAAGYIAVAAGQGLIKGYPDGTFKPEAQVSYAEAITMLVRALGYKDEFLPGAWPGNYLAKAAEKSVTDKVKFTDAAGFASRGDVAVLVNNTLDAKVVKVDTYENGNVKYYESDKTLLEDKLDITKYENTRILADQRIDDSLDSNEVNVAFLKDTDDDKYSKTDEATFNLADGVTVEPVIGEEATIYLNDDDEIVYAESEGDNKVAFDYVEGVTSTGDDTVVSLVKLDDDYGFADDAVVYGLVGSDYKQISLGSLDSDMLLGKVGKFVLKNDKIVYAYIVDPTEVDNWMVVTKNDNGLLTGVSGTDDAKEIDLTTDGDYDGVIVMDTAGNAMTPADIDKGNLVYVQKQDINGDDYAVVWVVKDNVVTGTLDKVKSDRITVGGKEIKLTKTGDDIHAAYTVNNGDDIYWYNLGNEQTSSDMEDADGATITAYTDAAGRIAYFTTEAEATSGYKYGIVTKIYTDSEKLKIYTLTDNGEGDEVTYPVEDTDNLYAAYLVNEYGDKTGEVVGNEQNPVIDVGSVVKFKLNKNGEIAEDEIYVQPHGSLANAWTMTNDDFGKDSVPGTNGDSTDFSVDDNTVIIDAKGLQQESATDYTFDTDDFSVVKWADLAEDENFSGSYYVFTADDNNVDAKAIIFIGNGCGGAAEDEQAAYVVDKWYKGGDLYASVKFYDGELKDIKVDSGSEDILSADERPYVVKVQADGELEVLNDASSTSFEIYYGWITNKDGDTVTAEVYDITSDITSSPTVSSTKTFKLSSKSVIYEEDGAKSSSSLHNGDAVYFVVEDGVNIRVIERLIDTEKDAVLVNHHNPYPY